MQIGVGLIEYLSFLTLATGVLWLAALLRKPVTGQAGKKPVWIAYGAEFFGVVVLILICRVALADWMQVPSGSMEPTLRVGDRILVNKLAYGPRLPFTNLALKLGTPERGDVMVFRYPLDVSTLYVKRLIGLPGDVVAYHNGVVSVNHVPFQSRPDDAVVPQQEDRGQIFERETVEHRERTIKLDADEPGARIMPVAWMQEVGNTCVVLSPKQWQCTVPKGKYLMMGDNRDNSVDSRVWGFLDDGQVYGKVVKVIVNFSDLSRAWMPLL
jgi:signal peptidase I